MSDKVLAQRVFTELYESIPNIQKIDPQETEGIVTSINDFLSILQDAHSQYNKIFAVPESEQLVILEDTPRELLLKLNNPTQNFTIDTQTLNDLRIVTYTASEQPAIVSAHKYNSDGIRNLKYRLIGTYDDPKYPGYTVLRFGKEIEAKIDFKVWGLNFQDIRKRAKLLRDIISDYTWYLKHKGLREIIWLGSVESDMWDNKTIVKSKTESYTIKFVEIRETKEKNLEQIVVQAGIVL